MSDNTPKNVQDKFLTDLVASGKACAIFLVNGIRLNGVLKDHDRYCVVLNGQNGGAPQLIYKHAISTVSPDATSSSGNRRP